MFSLICVWINDWVNNREAGDLRRHRSHYDVNVMLVGISESKVRVFVENRNPLRRMFYHWKNCSRFNISRSPFVITEFGNTKSNITGWARPFTIQLTHWGRVMHICVSKLTSTVSDNGLSPGRRQAIIWTNAGILLIGPLGTNFSEILIGIRTFWLKKMRLKMLSGKWRPFCLSLNVLTIYGSSSQICVMVQYNAILPV